MSNYLVPSQRRAAGRQTWPNSSSWVGWIAFAALMLALTGIFHLMQGLVALTTDDYFAVTSSRLMVGADYTTWGWVQLLWGVVLLVAGGFVLTGQVWARAVGVLAALLSATTSLGFMAAAPVWALLMIGLDIMIILALTVHGRDMDL